MRSCFSAVIFLIGGVAGVAACHRTQASPEQPVGRAPAVGADLTADLDRVRQARIFFSHHSVGGNVLAGVESLYREAGRPGFKLVDLKDVLEEKGPGWIEGVGGKNGAPRSKIDFFAETIRKEKALQPRIAFMKFCYVDFNPHTDVDELFGHYASTLAALKREHPEITFAHVTAPLMRRPTEIKWRILRLMGRMVWEDDANVKRHRFNQRLLKEFAADPIFDLARAESTRPDGSRETFTHGDGVFHSLEPSYTNDGGHLNDLGQRVVGAEMVRFVSKALQASSRTL
ncbi:MAG: hypothetical protein ABUL77_00575 [Bacteroidota bacterium]